MKKKIENNLSIFEHKPPPQAELQIVAIGASAGGLEAVTELLQNMTANTGLVFVYISHLSPEHESLLTNILSRVTAMKVQEVTDRVKMLPNNVYLIPPGKAMKVLDGHIQLTERTTATKIHLPIDIFFTSLAEVHKEDAIGVILSGSANDGTRGLKAIRACGGITFAQNNTAKFKSMPESAVAAGVVDYVLTPKEIAAQIIAISKHEFALHRVKQFAENQVDNNDPSLKIIFNLLLQHTQIDLSYYKLPTIKRRILRRMLLNKNKLLKEYALFASQNTDEVRLLSQDLLISVTSFFRDADASEYLQKALMPKILAAKSANEKLRVWVPACATGEEAYSIAITIIEIQQKLGFSIPVQIFATDISVKAIATARIGMYTQEDIATLSIKQVDTYFLKTGNKYTVTKALRNMCVFAAHDVLKSPPYSKIDLISCCNLFIYLNNTAQKKVLNIFHFALKDTGFLILGKSETIATNSQLFEPINTKIKVYSKKTNSTKNSVSNILPIKEQTIDKIKLFIESANTNKLILGFDNELDLLLLSKYIPASVVINYSMDIVHFRGDTHLYLKHLSGNANLNLLKMAPSELAFELRQAIPMVIQSKQPFSKIGIEIKSLPNIKLVNIEVVPVNITNQEPLLLVMFTQPITVQNKSAGIKSATSVQLAKDAKILRLEEELTAFKIDMQKYAYSQEQLIEELQSANEEVISNNEEMQSINEELETTKEEIESTNEELTTTNEELLTRNGLLMEAYQYSDALLSNLNEPVLVLNKQFRVLSASKNFYEVFFCTAEDTEGLLFFEIANKEWDIPQLKELLNDMIPKKKYLHKLEIKHNFSRMGTKVLAINARIIVQETHNEVLILLTIEDISDVKIAEQLVKESEERYQAAVSAVLGIVWTNSADGNMYGEQKSWEYLTGQTFEEYQGYGWTKAIHPDDRQPTVSAWQVAVNNKSNFIFEHRVLLKNGSWGHFSVRALPTFNLDGSIKQWVGVHTDITAKKIAEDKILNLANELEVQVIDRTKKLAISNKKLEENNVSLQILNKELQAFSYVASHDLQEPLRKIQTLANRIIETEGTLSTKGKDYFERMQKAAERMQALIQDLLAFSNIQSTDGKPFTTCNLNVVVEDAKIELSELIKETKATINVSKLCDVQIIPFQLRQVFVNLISNAIKFTKQNVAPIITIKSKIVKYDIKKPKVMGINKDYCHITVADNGIGFEPNYNEKIFEVFQRLHNRDEYPGTGIGLAIVKKIIENHNGVITAKAVQGKGATFEIYLPL